jgi:hypothetical protein
MKHLLTIFFIVCFTGTVKSQDPQDYSWARYDTGMVRTDSLSKLTPYEIKISGEFDEFEFNHQRLQFLNLFEKKQLLEYDPTILDQYGQPFISLPCKCRTQKDTVYVATPIGLFSGIGLLTAITKDNFGVTFYNYLDNKKELSISSTPPVFTENITVPAVQQKLTLLKAPSFSRSEEITGLLEAEFKEYYRYNPETRQLVPQQFKVSVIFKCQSKQVRE